MRIEFSEEHRVILRGKNGMSTKSAVSCIAISIVIAGCAGSDGGAEASGGSPASAGSAGKPVSSAAGASPFGGAGTAGESTSAVGGGGTGGIGVSGGSSGATAGSNANGGNAGNAGAASGGAAAGGSSSGGGAGGTGGASGDIWGGLKNPPRKSTGCDKPAMLTNGKKTIMSGGVARSYIIDIPADYDPAKPYRLFYVSHGLGGRAEDVAGPFNFFGLKPQATAAKDPAIFVAGQGLNNTWGQVDHAFFDDVTAFVKESLCIDTTRVFVTGMSMGGMYSYSLSTDRQKAFRAGVGLAPTNYNIWLPNPKLKDPIAWMQTTGNVDTFCPWVADEAQKRGSKFIALEKATDNGCNIPASIPTWQSGNHVCYDFTGCKPGYPVKACTFNGPHTDSNRDPGSNTNWIAKESWEFFTQF
jgi:poly(3-hydroxybutyrate) depolymerase